MGWGGVDWDGGMGSDGEGRYRMGFDKWDWVSRMGLGR